MDLGEIYMLMYIPSDIVAWMKEKFVHFQWGEFI